MRPTEIQDQIEAEREGVVAAESLPVSPWLGCLLSALLGLLGAFLVFQAGKLMIQGDLRFGSDPLTSSRLWLVSEGGNRGLGWSSSTVVEGSPRSQRACSETRVRFLLYRTDGTAQPVTYCECFQRSGDRWRDAGACSPEVGGGS